MMVGTTWLNLLLWICRIPGSAITMIWHTIYLHGLPGFATTSILFLLGPNIVTTSAAWLVPASQKLNATTPVPQRHSAMPISRRGRPLLPYGKPTSPPNSSQKLLFSMLLIYAALPGPYTPLSMNHDLLSTMNPLHTAMLNWRGDLCRTPTENGY